MYFGFLSTYQRPQLPRPFGGDVYNKLLSSLAALGINVIEEDSGSHSIPNKTTVEIQTVSTRTKR